MNIQIQKHDKKRLGNGFSLIEALITISLLAVLSAIVISSYTDASTQSHQVIARQQAAAVKSALDSYINSQLSTVAGGGGVGAVNKLKSISTVRTEYNALSTSAKWDVISQYIDPESLSDRRNGGFQVVGDSITTTSLEKSGDVLNFPAWGATNTDYPLVDITPTS